MTYAASVPLFSRFAENQVNGVPSNPYTELTLTVFVAAVLMVCIARSTWSTLRALLSNIRSK